jgi:hypothetical protein
VSRLICDGLRASHVSAQQRFPSTLFAIGELRFSVPLDTSGYPSRVGMTSGFRPDASHLADKILGPKIRYRSAIDPTERACGRRPCLAISPCVQLVARFAGEQRTLGASKMMVYRLHLYSLINRDEVFSSFQIARKLYS